MPSAGFEPVIMAIKLLQNYALYSRATEIETINKIKYRSRIKDNIEYYFHR